MDILLHNICLIAIFCKREWERFNFWIMGRNITYILTHHPLIFPQVSFMNKDILTTMDSAHSGITVETLFGHTGLGRKSLSQQQCGIHEWTPKSSPENCAFPVLSICSAMSLTPSLCCLPTPKWVAFYFLYIPRAIEGVPLPSGLQVHSCCQSPTRVRITHRASAVAMKSSMSAINAATSKAVFKQLKFSSLISRGWEVQGQGLFCFLVHIRLLLAMSSYGVRGRKLHLFFRAYGAWFLFIIRASCLL